MVSIYQYFFFKNPHFGNSILFFQQLICWFLVDCYYFVVYSTILVYWIQNFAECSLPEISYRVPGFATGFQSYFLYSAQAAQTQHGSASLSAEVLSQTQCLSSAEWFVRWWGLRHLHFLILFSFLLHLCQLSFLKF